MRIGGDPGHIADWCPQARALGGCDAVETVDGIPTLEAAYRKREGAHDTTCTASEAERKSLELSNCAVDMNTAAWKLFADATQTDMAQVADLARSKTQECTPELSEEGT